MANKSPCKDCSDRHIGCHSNCVKYKQYDEQNKIRRSDLRKQHEMSVSLSQLKQDRVPKGKRKNGRNP